MYRYYVNKRAPISFWMLDDTVPFQEYSGFPATAGQKSGSGAPTTSVPLVAGAEFSSVFKSSSVGQFSQNVFKVGLENRPFVLEAWVLPVPKTSTGDQQILSHGTSFDGLTINGKVIRFGTSYATTGDAFCDYDLIEYQKAHVVCIHNADQNQLWINGQLVAHVDITDAQKADSYIAAADGFLNSGYTTSTQEIAMNGVAIYPTLSGDQIAQNYLAGNDTIGQKRVAPQYSGVPFNLDAGSGSIFFDNKWVNSTDFELGLKNNVEYASDQINPSYEAGLSVAGSWTVGIPLDAQGDTSIYGVMVQWSGKDVTVDTSLDGITWTAATSGALVSIISSGYDPTGKDLQVRVNFSGGLADDPAYLESLTVIGLRNNTVANISTRSVTVTSPAVLRGDYEPTLYRDDNGANLHGGTLTIGADSTADPQVARTVEVWIKPISGTPTITGGSFTKYRNGSADTTIPIGEWSLLHYVAGADIAGNIDISGDCIVGQVTLYPTAFSAGDVDFVADSYFGRALVRITDTENTLSITEDATPSNIYTHDWSINGAG